MSPTKVSFESLVAQGATARVLRSERKTTKPVLEKKARINKAAQQEPPMPPRKPSPRYLDDGEGIPMRVIFHLTILDDSHPEGEYSLGNLPMGVVIHDLRWETPEELIKELEMKRVKRTQQHLKERGLKPTDYGYHADVYLAEGPEDPSVERRGMRLKQSRWPVIRDMMRRKQLHDIDNKVDTVGKMNWHMVLTFRKKRTDSHMEDNDKITYNYRHVCRMSAPSTGVMLV
jgi:hypothetical protein